MDPLTTPLLVLVLGNLAKDLITDACKDHLKDKLKSIFGWLETLGEKDKVEPAYIDAMEQAFGTCLEMLLQNIKAQGYSDEELKQYQNSIKEFIKDKEVAEELLKAVREPGRNELPSPDVLRDRWQALGGQELPADTLWSAVASAFRRQIIKRAILSDDLRELLNAENLQQLKELIERQGGVKVQVRRDKYSLRMRSKFSPVDLANLMPSYADDPGRMVIQDVFVSQNVRENPPPVEIPKDIAERLRKGGHHETCDNINEALDEKQLEKFRTSYISQAPKSVLDVIAAPGNRLLVLTGEPGSGKSTLMRYLLTCIIEPPIYQFGQPLPWCLAFKDTFPLLIELRDFYALRQRNECCETFLEYVAYMGKTDQWFLDDHTVHGYLENSPSIVMFDGLDEIFDAGDRERIMHEIAGFAQRYPKVQIVVTSRPVGYKEQVLREAGFVRYGIQDLDDEQIDTFIRGWFTLTFPLLPQQANQRIERVLASVRQSKPIRLLAGNPMLLTIMALLAREEELPRERAKFYEKAVEVLCHHWDANRNLELSEDRYLNADDKKNLLRRIAMRMQSGNGGLKGNFITEDDLEQVIQTYLISEQWQTDAAEAKKAARRMIQQLRERNYILCLRGPHLYGFVHRTFLEYLTAAEYVRMFDRQPQQITIDELIEQFDRHCQDAEWREVLRLICGQIDEQFVGRIVEHLATRVELEKWDGRTPLPELPLAIWCLSEIRSSNRIADSASKLLMTIVACFLKGRSPSREFILEIVAASKDVGTRWPGRSVFKFSNQFPSSTVFYHHWYWPHFLGDVFEQRDWIEKLALCESWDVRRGSIETLAEKWPDESTRKFVTDRTTQDEHYNARSAALQALARAWPDESTRKFLTDRATQDKHYNLRSAALQSLARTWPDDNTRKLLTVRATQDEHFATRSATLQILTEKWSDEMTRKLVTDRTTLDKHFSVRRTAFQALAKTWPDEITRKIVTECTTQDKHSSTRRSAFQTLAKIWPDEITRKLLTERVTQNETIENKDQRSAALQCLAKTWPDEITRKLLTECTTHDDHFTVRRTTLNALAEKWPDEITRKLLIERATQDDHFTVRRTALQLLTEIWPDEITRKLLTERATQDDSEDIRSAILKWLAEIWAGSNTQKLLTDRANQDEHFTVRSAALQALAEKWPDEITRKLLTEFATKNEHYTVQRVALQSLTEMWPDEITRKLLSDRATEADHPALRGATLQALAEKWPDEITRKLLTERAIQDDHFTVRRTALLTITKRWLDEITRKLLTNRTVQDEHFTVRLAALQTLAEKWPDEITQKLLTERANKDDDKSLRSAVLQMLAKKWPDENTRKLLRKQAIDFTLAGSQLAELCVTISKIHSEFGRIVFTVDLDGSQPYLELDKPIPRKQIERAAEKAGVPIDKVDGIVSSLSAYLGWDITRGVTG